MKKLLGYSLYILSIIPLILYIYISNNPIYSFNEITRLGIIGIGTLLMYFGGFFLSKAYNSNKPMKINLYIFFIVYLILVITLTLFDASWGRSGIKIKSLHNVSKYINLKPFKTIKSFLMVFDSYLYSTKDIMLNLFGNLSAFMPMSIFLPLIFKKQNKFYVFLFTMILFVGCIEGLQLATGSGRCDIDDLILNVGGAFILYLILKIPPMKKLLRNVLLLEGNKVSKIFISFVIICIIGIISSLVYLVNYREKLYQNHLNKLYSKYSFNVEVQDRARYCSAEEEMFYEDDLYKYYFECNKSDNVYVIINEREYKLKEVLVDDFEYDVSIELLGNLGLKYKRKNKYTYINMSTKSLEKEENIYSKPTIFYEKDDDILAVMTSDYSISESNYKYKLHLIPKSSGETILYVIAKDGEEIIEKLEYKIQIDESLKVKYELIDSKMGQI